MGIWAGRADAVLLGADSVSAGGIRNKASPLRGARSGWPALATKLAPPCLGPGQVGSLLVALAARRAGKQVVAVADSWKISPCGRVSTRWVCTCDQVRRAPWHGGGLTCPTVPRAPTLGLARMHTRRVKSAPLLGPALGEEIETFCRVWGLCAPWWQSEEHEEDKGEGEVRGSWPSTLVAVGGLRVHNAYFERVPWDLVDAVITEDGPLGAEEVQRRLAARESQMAQGLGI